MSKLDVEALKRASNGLRGSIPEELATPADHFSDEAIQLLKFHGVYQQDDRDARKSARETGAGRDFSCMIRTKCPGARQSTRRCWTRSPRAATSTAT